MTEPCHDWPVPRRRKGERAFRPEPYSQGPAARAAHEAGGKLITAPLNRARFNARLAAYAPGCGGPVSIPPFGGSVPCGAKFQGRTVFCPGCLPKLDNRAETVARRLLED
jgi:hypothetical protein